ncbi:MOSC domain-containing protein [Brachybacterium ginsengisoli]|uniref:MOSC domain-containing protein n=1 Tax=Brachybacterium ginsengisoli TaxID=1331682 RepID=A0A291GTA3_9MICO|nr:MOSC domain-containing protein [Brachybacterium ginsengisoli]ATG53451.1 MOSC domain-containing protein [Brachybacterium ginsengisoli]
MNPTVVSVHVSAEHGFSKPRADSIELLEGIGVRGDAHAGVTVKHRSRVARNPDQPNLRQVHLIHQELFAHLAEQGHEVAPGELGENITTAGVDLLALPVGTRLRIGEAVVVVTGLRNPCQQIEDFRPGLLRSVLPRDDAGTVHRLTGVMGIVARGGTVRATDEISVDLPPEPHHPLTQV